MFLVGIYDKVLMDHSRFDRAINLCTRMGLKLTRKNFGINCDIFKVNDSIRLQTNKFNRKIYFKPC